MKTTIRVMSSKSKIILKRMRKQESSLKKKSKATPKKMKRKKRVAMKPPLNKHKSRLTTSPVHSSKVSMRTLIAS